MSRDRAAPPLLEQRDIFGRVAGVIGARQDAEVAKALGATAQNYATWKARGTIPFEKLCEFAQSRALSLDWLLLGIGEPNQRSVIDVDLFTLIYQALWRGAQEIGGESAGPYVVANACTAYNAVAATQDLAERERKAGMRVNLALASLAHASVSLLKNQAMQKTKKTPGLAAEIARLEALAKKFDLGA